MVTGSYVYGTPTEESDLDIRMITNNGYEKAHWDDLWRFGVRIEAFYNTSEFIREQFEKARKQTIPPNVIHFWAHGKIVYDPNGIARKLQEKAKKYWELGPYEGRWPKREKK